MYRNVHLRLILDQMIPSADNQPIVIHFFSLTKKKKKPLKAIVIILLDLQGQFQINIK